jgi:hypothetical protein
MYDMDTQIKFWIDQLKAFQKSLGQNFAQTDRFRVKLHENVETSNIM